MIKFSFISAFSILTVFSQETESSLINNNDTLNVAIQKTDSLEVDTTEASLNDVMNSIDTVSYTHLTLPTKRIV